MGLFKGLVETAKVAGGCHLHQDKERMFQAEHDIGICMADRIRMRMYITITTVYRHLCISVFNTC